MSGQDAQDEFTSLSNLPRGEDAAGPDPAAFQFTTTENSIRQTAENAIAYQVGRGQFVLFFIGGAQLVFMLFFTFVLADSFALADQSQRRDGLMLLTWLLGMVTGVSFIGLALWSRRDPLLAAIIALSAYAAANLLDLFLFFGKGVSFLPGGFWCWLIRALLVAFLIDAVRAAVAYKRIVNKMIAEMRRAD